MPTFTALQPLPPARVRLRQWQRCADDLQVRIFRARFTDTLQNAF